VLAVVFDLWGTLIHDSPALEGPRREQRLGDFLGEARARGIDLSMEEIEAGFRRHLQEHALMHGRGEDLQTGDRFAHCLETVRPGLSKVPGLVAAVDDAFAEAILRYPPVLDPEAPALLAALKDQGYRLGLLSNTAMSGGPTLRQLPNLQVALALFDDLVFSDEVCMSKPNPAIFRLSLERLQAEPSRSVFVGDNPVMDVAGAQSAGLHAVQIGNSAEDGVTPDSHIDRLSDLPLVVEHWRKANGWT
jgi:putative hydrolase of the HAD superfamily